ncbi:hypothetical protein [Streptomyces sp. CFMR 7]|uniref:hypothetical protein n=1 Tax=Streptomyces sp. CFMR 7 TaxID=1649184 RepID=UPI00119E2BB1|nr:hypothetical protein [Streptomyces sp. CFMR 7]
MTDRDEAPAPVTLFCTDTATATTGDAATVTDRMAERHGTTRIAVVPESVHDVHLDGPAAVYGEMTAFLAEVAGQGR